VAMRLLSIGYIQSLAQNEIVALPSRRTLLFCDAAAPTFFQSNDPAFGVSVAVTLANGQAELAGGFLRVTSAGPVNVKLDALS
jgi:hypothetical protein